ncbi:substrate-binding periplasmic protein [Planctobacterium marinum]|uniref:Solute-binding protein family 3/N-terminal domain-containing protein n=1 Tax=Planctobacterium marinum TaxID=1631968 RepID=A0AA48HMT0_9ALTE|nr:hypothetical protein MACH26_08730 [Planctobacterium marinum]
MSDSLFALKTFLILTGVAVVLLLAPEAGAHATDDSVKTTEVEPLTIVHSGVYAENDYTIELLRLVLQRAGNQYQLQALGYWPPRGRDFAMMESKDGIDIMWGSARQDREDRFLTIRIPLFKGLIGWRIPFVHESKLNLFEDVSDLSALSNYRPGQYFSWTDTRILKHNGIDVFEANNRPRLVDMLVNHKFDYFPRAAIEIMHEYQQHQHQGVRIEPHLLIIYPTAFYYYVQKDNQALADNLKLGLETIIANGEMDALFFQHFGEILKTLAIHKRKVIRLDNPFIPPKAPFERKDLWLQPEQFTANSVE